GAAHGGFVERGQAARDVPGGAVQDGRDGAEGRLGGFDRRPYGPGVGDVGGDVAERDAVGGHGVERGGQLGVGFGPGAAQQHQAGAGLARQRMRAGGGDAFAASGDEEHVGRAQGQRGGGVVEGQQVQP